MEGAQGERIKFPAVKVACARILDAPGRVSLGRPHGPRGPGVSRRQGRAGSQAVSFLTGELGKLRRILRRKEAAIRFALLKRPRCLQGREQM